MGQYWRPFNIDKREGYDRHQGNLGEYLFWTEPHKMFYHLLRLAVRFSAAEKPLFNETK
jgi:hypothetical protein